MKDFILEFGKDFSFVGQEYKLQVGNSVSTLICCFFNRELSCLVAIELKTGKFRPEHMGQLDFYLEALDRDVKKPNENPSVGLILCEFLFSCTENHRKNTVIQMTFFILFLSI